jgi:hypothetical protein
LYFVYGSPTVTRKLSVSLCVFVRRFVHTEYHTAPRVMEGSSGSNRTL